LSSISLARETQAQRISLGRSPVSWRNAPTPCRSPVKAAGYFHRPIIPVEMVAVTPIPSSIF
ncbi:MAG: hypothetical protein ACKOEZ_00030, partial [Spartobacteria bacterium]